MMPIDLRYQAEKQSSLEIVRFVETDNATLGLSHSAEVEDTMCPGENLVSKLIPKKFPLGYL